MDDEAAPSTASSRAASPAAAAGEPSRHSLRRAQTTTVVQRSRRLSLIHNVGASLRGDEILGAGSGAPPEPAAHHTPRVRRFSLHPHAYNAFHSEAEGGGRSLGRRSRTFSVGVFGLGVA